MGNNKPIERIFASGSRKLSIQTGFPTQSDRDDFYGGHHDFFTSDSFGRLVWNEFQVYAGALLEIRVFGRFYF